jgi:hypothetical protein
MNAKGRDKMHPFTGSLEAAALHSPSPATRLRAFCWLPEVLRKHTVTLILGPVAGSRQQALLSQLTHSSQLPISSDGTGESCNHALPIPEYGRCPLLRSRAPAEDCAVSRQFDLRRRNRSDRYSPENKFSKMSRRLCGRCRSRYEGHSSRTGQGSTHATKRDRRNHANAHRNLA